MSSKVVDLARAAIVEYEMRTGKTYRNTRADIQTLKPGDHVVYFGWRGPEDVGEGLVREVKAIKTGYGTTTTVLVKRFFSADGGYLFYPLVSKDYDTLILVKKD